MKDRSFCKKQTVGRISYQRDYFGADFLELPPANTSGHFWGWMSSVSGHPPRAAFNRLLTMRLHCIQLNKPGISCQSRNPGSAIAGIDCRGRQRWVIIPRWSVQCGLISARVLVVDRGGWNTPDGLVDPVPARFLFQRKPLCPDLLVECRINSVHYLLSGITPGTRRVRCWSRWAGRRCFAPAVWNPKCRIFLRVRGKVG